jgi:site-specific recombinase XerD
MREPCRATEFILDDDTLFLAKNGTSLNVSSVKAIIAKYVKKAGIRKRVSVHTLRHTFGTHKADKHMSIATLRALMGHKKKKPRSNISIWREPTAQRDG